MGPLQRAPGTAPTAFSPDLPWLRRRERSSLVKNRMRGALGEAGMSLPVQVWSVQSLASRTGASPTGVTATWGLERGQRLDGFCRSAVAAWSWLKQTDLLPGKGQFR